MSDRKCHVCHGKRLRPEVLAVTVGGKSIDVYKRQAETYSFIFNGKNIAFIKHRYKSEHSESYKDIFMFNDF